MNLKWKLQSLNNVPNLTDNEAHVWKTKISENLSNLEMYSSLLTSTEQSLAARFYLDKDKNRYIISKAILKILLANYIKINLKNNSPSPSGILFEYNSYGKPFLSSKMNIYNLRFNLAHSGDSIIYIFANNCEVGIDIEYCDSKLITKEMFDSCCSSQEKFFLQNLPCSEINYIYFYMIWVVKEAITKSYGMGLSYDIKKISVDLSKIISTNFDNSISIKLDNFEVYPNLLQSYPGYFSAFALSRKIDLISGFSLIS